MSDIVKETEAERDRLKAFIAKAEIVKKAAGQPGFIAALKGALAKLEESLAIMRNAEQT
jgi:hypothetical protein